MARTMLLLGVLCAFAALSEAFVNPGVSALRSPTVRSGRSVTMSVLGGSKVGGKFSGGVSEVSKGPLLGGGFGCGNDGGVGGGGGDNRPDKPEDDGEDEKPAGGLAAIWASYNSALETSPIVTKGLTSLTGFAVGDFLAQTFIEKKGTFDFARLLRMAGFGFLIHGPSGHWFYGVLDSKIPGVSAPRVASKVFIDQVLWNPIFGIMFFSYLGLTESGSFAAAKEKVEKQLVTAVTGSWKVWPVAHAINFRFIPNSQRLLYINSVQIFYNCFLSIIGNR